MKRPSLSKGLLVSGAIAIGGAFPAAADEFSHCDRIKDPAKSAACYGAVVHQNTQRRLAAAEKRYTEAAQRNNDAVAGHNNAVRLNKCAKFLAAYSGPLPPLTAQNACTVAEAHGYRPH